MQLDLFADSRDVMLRNDVLDALQKRHASDARQAWQRLKDECPADDTLPALAMLVSALDEASKTRFTDHHALAVARRALDDGIAPAARRVFGDQAAPHMADAVLASAGAASRRPAV